MYRVISLAELPTIITHDMRNLLTLQVRSPDNPEEWLDYASIKDSDDLRYARGIAEKEPNRYRFFGRLSEPA
jgi:hypothetical protein